MKKIIRLSESQLTEIIKKVISEAETSTSMPVKGPGPTGKKPTCRDPYILFSYTSSSGTPTYQCNSVNGWKECGTNDQGQILCCCMNAQSQK